MYLYPLSHLVVEELDQERCRQVHEHNFLVINTVLAQNINSIGGYGQEEPSHVEELGRVNYSAGLWGFKMGCLCVCGVHG
jgi:hypothetical protein